MLCAYNCIYFHLCIKIYLCSPNVQYVSDFCVLFYFCKFIFEPYDFMLCLYSIYVTIMFINTDKKILSNNCTCIDYLLDTDNFLSIHSCRKANRQVMRLFHGWATFGLRKVALVCDLRLIWMT